jgi:hypothetical protein
VQVVGGFCEARGVEYVGIVYTEAEKIRGQLPYSKKRAELQLKTLKDKGAWPSDEEAEKQLSVGR